MKLEKSDIRILLLCALGFLYILGHIIHAVFQ